ncbi:MAG: NAD(P)/FAD-dependent oxidoreductase [Proteobacteria bacterium]|nr:MAG: NAD(P)/FAD-dependent oxidoreductase [Pseudomonadota bacterium]
MKHINTDVLIVGGGPAGLEAAMILGRGGRSVILCDDDRPRNARVAQMHYFPTRDGMSPKDFREAFHQDLSHYEKISIKNVRVEKAARNELGFISTLSNGEIVQSKKIIIATGVKDIMPAIPGYEEHFATTVFHCPFCHGYEHRNQALAVVANGDMGMHMIAIMLGLSPDLVVFTNGPSQFSGEQLSLLKSKNIRLEESPIREILGDGKGHLRTILLQDGTRVDREAMLFRPDQKQKSDLALELGCTLNDMGLIEAVDGVTKQKGVFVAGDTVDMKQSALTATYYGLLAGVMANNELAMEALHGH